MKLLRNGSASLFRKVDTIQCKFIKSLTIGYYRQSNRSHGSLLTFRPTLCSSRHHLEIKMGSCADYIFVQDFNEVLVMISTAAGDAVFTKFYK